jgi:hypothetical protein
VKTKRILAGACIALSLCLFVAALIGITCTQPQKAYGNVTAGYPVFGNTQLVVSGSAAGVLNLSGTAATSIPCNNMLLNASTTGCTIGSTTGSATFPLASGLQTLPFPVTNVNQVWCQVSGGTGTVTVNAVYAQ